MDNGEICFFLNAIIQSEPHIVLLFPLRSSDFTMISFTISIRKMWGYRVSLEGEIVCVFVCKCFFLQ